MKEEEVWADLQEIQSIMNILGFMLSDKELGEILTEYLDSGLDDTLEALCLRAKAEGKGFSELVNEHLNLEVKRHE